MRFLPALAALGLAGSVLPAAAATLLVPQHYPTITAALAAARPYDTIVISPKPGGKPYDEAVTIATSHLLLQGVGSPVLDGTGQEMTVSDPPFAPTTTSPVGVEITADHVTLSGLTIQNFGATDSSGFGSSAISVDPAPGAAGSVTISGNTIRHNYTGLAINGVSASSGAYLDGYRVVGNDITGNLYGGASITGQNSLAAGNIITGTQFSDGLDVAGLGFTITGNEFGGNAGYGLNVTDYDVYNPAVNTPGSPNPTPTVVALNSAHDNGSYGFSLTGTETVSGNAALRNAGYGIYLTYADYSTVTGNLISGTLPDGMSNDYGTGLYADYTEGFTSSGTPGATNLTISYNQISGNTGDGVFFNEISGSRITGNTVDANGEIGIHLSDYTDYGYYPFDTVTGDTAQRNTRVDARDDGYAPDTIAYNDDTFYGDGDPADPDVWTHNAFGTTDPVGLSK